LTSVFTSVSSYTADQLSSLFSMLPLSLTICKFKLALCQRYLDVATSAARPRVQPRAARAPQRKFAGEENSISEATPQTSFQPTISGSGSSKYKPPAVSEIIRLLGLNTNGRNSSVTDATMRIKFELLTSFAVVQENFGDDSEKAKWSSLLREGLSEACTAAFGEGELGKGYRESLLAVLTI